MKKRRLFEKNKTSVMKDRTSGKPDYILFIVTALLVGFGVLMVYSASMYSAQIGRASCRERV